ncbi:MAG: PEP/pyruvate-binding domain-containing protein, partial [Sediminispirochaetaceae bacterium]
MIVSLGKGDTMNRPDFGGKAAVLNELIGLGYKVPEGIALSTDVYRQYLQQSGIKPWLSIQLEQRSLDDMRWEELWDLAQTIRLRFLRTPIPESLQMALLSEISGFSDFPVAVRSSSVLEDTPGLSFAGLHDSFTDVKGTYAILSAIREVWSSLWSDRALMYHRELELDTENAAMGVLVQRFIRGKASGVMFSRSPDNSSLTVIETVAGCNEDLVSGAREPDRIYIDRKDRKITRWLKADGTNSAELSEEQVIELVRIADSLENSFEHPQDIEWTIADEEIYILQSRPITTIKEADTPLWKLEDKRKWHASQHQSLAELYNLRKRITESFLPSVQEISSELAEADLDSMDKTDLEQELQRRNALVEEWDYNYWELFIPFAHGVRLFGETYNRIVQPESPFEFIQLLVHQDFRSVRRNTQLQQIARLIHDSGTTDSFEELPPHIR